MRLTAMEICQREKKFMKQSEVITSPKSNSLSRIVYLKKVKFNGGIQGWNLGDGLKRIL
jgi:hypothetical protein